MANAQTGWRGTWLLLLMMSQPASRHRAGFFGGILVKEKKKEVTTVAAECHFERVIKNGVREEMSLKEKKNHTHKKKVKQIPKVLLLHPVINRL